MRKEPIVGSANTLTSSRAAIEQNRGKVGHYAGDAVLADFGTVTDALTCAAAVQRDLQERNKDLPMSARSSFALA